MDTPILVTGALGNVGTEVVKQLQAIGRPVRAADVNPARVRERFGGTAEAVQFDFANPETYAKTFEGVEKMFLMRPPQISDVKRYMFPAIDAAKRAGIRQAVFLSLIGIENNTVVPHYKVEQYLKEIGVQTTFLRCSFFMQNLNTTHRKEIQERDEIFVPVGNARTSFIDVRDIGAVAAYTLTQDGHTNRNYDLTGSEALDYWQVADIMSEVLGRKITYRNPSPLQFFVGTMKRGASFPYAAVVTWLYMSTRSGMADRVTKEVEQITGQKPILFRQYVQDYRDAWVK